MDFIAFGFTILGVIIAAYILSHFGYLSRTVPTKSASGFGSRGYEAGYSAPATKTNPEMLIRRFEI